MQHNRDKDSDPRSTVLNPVSLQNSNNDLLSYLEVLVRNWQIIAKVTTVAIIISVIISYSMPNIFSATAKILPPQQDSSGLMGMMMGGSSGLGVVTAELLGKGTTSDMYVGILSCDAISDRIIERFKLMELYEQKYRISTYKVLHKHVNFSIGKKDGIISISVEDKDPKLAADIANAYVDELSRFTSKLNITGAVQSREYYEERLTNANAVMSKMEDNLKAFQGKYKALDITEQAKGTIKGVADLEAQLALEEVKLAGLRQSLTDSAQEVKSQRALIANIKAQIAKFEGNRTSGAVPGLSSVPEIGQQYFRLMRELKVQGAIVELLSRQYELAKLSEAKDTTSMQIIQSARVPDRKTKPKRALLVLMGTFVAFFFVVTYAFFREYLTKLSEEELNRLLALKSQLPFAKLRHK